MKLKFLPIDRISWRFTLWSLSIVIVLSLLVWGLMTFHRTTILPVGKVVVQGDLQQFNSPELKQIIKPFVQTGLFSVNLQGLQASLQQLPNVAYAEINRVWPNKINIILVDQNIVAYWNKNRLMNIYGETFPVKIIVNLKQVPQFFGPENSEVTVLGGYQQMNELLKPLNLTIIAIYLNSDKTWQIVLSSKTKLDLGNKAILKRLQHFVKAYPTLMNKHKRAPKSVDLQYPHGMAVEW